MAALFVSKKAFTVPPTVRTLASGVPSASLVNLSVRGSGGHGHDHGHGAPGPRSDKPSRWVGGISSSSTSGLVSRTFINGEKRSSVSARPSLMSYPPASPTGIHQQRLLHTSAVVKDAPQVPDFTPYQARSTSTNRGVAYFMIGSLGLVSASVAQSTVTEFLATMSASADVLALAKVEVELASIPEGKNVIIKWRGKPVFIRHRTQGEIDEATTADWKTMRHPESDESRAKRPEWLVMLGVCTHLGCVPIGEAGDYGGW